MFESHAKEKRTQHGGYASTLSKKGSPFNETLYCGFVTPQGIEPWAHRLRVLKKAKINRYKNYIKTTQKPHWKRL